MGVYNLPKVATRQRGGRGSNSRPLSHQSDASDRLSSTQLADPVRFRKLYKSHYFSAAFNICRLFLSCFTAHLGLL